MATKSSKMYADSPTAKRDETGKVGIIRIPMPSTMDAMGLRGGVGQQGAMGDMAISVHDKERDLMYSKHDLERAEMNTRHLKEVHSLKRLHAGLSEDADSPQEEGN